MIINRAGGNLVECDFCGRRVPALEARDTNLQPTNGWGEIVRDGKPVAHCCFRCVGLNPKLRTPAEQANIKKLNATIPAFADRMLDRLVEKADAGYTGWDGEYPEASLQNELVDDADLLRGENATDARMSQLAIDIANRAMMIWYRHGNKCEASHQVKLEICRTTHSAGLVCTREKGHSGSHCDRSGASW